MFSQQSKYIPIPLLTALSIVKKRKERFALVGLSCHIHGLHNVLDTKTSLKKQFTFSIGLVCDRVMVNAGMDYLIQKAEVEKKDVTEFYFRDKKPHGYPGHIHIKTAKQSYFFPPQERMSIKDYFTPARCRICFDKMNIGADITIGDPHGIEGVDRLEGESLVISRTQKGEEILQSINKDVDLRLEEYKVALIGQAIENKKEDWRGYIENWIELNKPVPTYYEYVSKFTRIKSNKRYATNIRQALFLRFPEQREELIIGVDKQLKKYKLKMKFLLPMAHIIRVIKKLKRNS